MIQPTATTATGSTIAKIIPANEQLVQMCFTLKRAFLASIKTRCFCKFLQSSFVILMFYLILDLDF